MMLSTLQPFTHLISPSRLPGGERVKDCVSLEEARRDDGKIGQRESKYWVGNNGQALPIWVWLLLHRGRGRGRAKMTSALTGTECSPQN